MLNKVYIIRFKINRMNQYRKYKVQNKQYESPYLTRNTVKCFTRNIFAHTYFNVLHLLTT